VSGTFPSNSESNPTQPQPFTFVLFCSVVFVNCQSSTPSPKVRFIVSLVAKATFISFLCFLIGYSSKIIMFLCQFTNSPIQQFTNSPISTLLYIISSFPYPFSLFFWIQMLFNRLVGELEGRFRLVAAIVSRLSLYFFFPSRSPSRYFDSRMFFI